MALDGKSLLENLELWTSALLTKSTAGRGGNGKLEAYGIKKLRELILELAVRGKLVPQDPSDEPASELLKRTIAEKIRLIKENVIRETKTPVCPDESPDHELPGSWVWTNLHEIGEIAPRNEADDNVEASFVPMQSISETYGVPVQHEVKPWGEIKSGFTHFREEDVVLAKITPCFQNGKSAVMRGLTNGFGTGTTELHVYRSINACTVPEYVLIYLKSPRFISDGIPKMTGTAGQKRITRDYFAGKHFPLPPLREQHRIVAKVDELMALCDQLEQQQTLNIEAHQTLVETLLGSLTKPTVRAELVEARPSTGSGRTSFEEAWSRIAGHFDTLFTTEHSIDQLKQTILQLAVMGKLVPQDPSDEPASVLLRRIAEEKARLFSEGEIRKQKSLSEIGESEKPHPLPGSWEWVRFGDIALQVTDGAHHTPTYVSEGIPFLSVKDMSTGKLDFSDTRFIARDQHEELIKRCYPQRGDLLLTKVGTTGIPVLVDTDEEFSIFVSVALIKFPQDKIHGRFLSLLVGSPLVKRQSEEGTEGIGNKNLVLRKIAAFVLAIPPLAEQHRIVAKVDELMALCDALKARTKDAQTTQIHLADAIVEEAVA